MYRSNNMCSSGSYMPNFRDKCYLNNHPSSQMYKRKVSYNNSYSFGHQPFSDEYWCETCDRGFRTEKILEDHKKQHQKCNIDGCQFIAHPKVIIKHVQMQHSTGLYKKIAKLNNPEEIEKWREDRRKKYPTKINIEKKNLEIKEKIERGEKMGLGSSKNYRDSQMHMNKKRSFDNHSSRKHNVMKRDFPTKNNEKQFSKKLCKIISVSVESRKLKPFAGVQHIIIDKVNNEEQVLEVSPDLIEDDEFMVEDKHKISLTSEPVVCGALTSLINDYGSSEEEETEKTSSNQMINNSSLQACSKSSILEDSKKKNKDEEIEGDSGPEEVKVGKEADTVNSETPFTKTQKNSYNRNTFKEKQNKKNYKDTFKRKIPSTLLEKLLSNEIRQERNIVLQCVRYIVRNNYFN